MVLLASTRSKAQAFRVHGKVRKKLILKRVSPLLTGGPRPLSPVPSYSAQNVCSRSPDSARGYLVIMHKAPASAPCEATSLSLHPRPPTQRSSTLCLAPSPVCPSISTLILAHPLQHESLPFSSVSAYSIVASSSYGRPGRGKAAQVSSMVLRF